MSDTGKPTARRKATKRQSRLRFELLNAFVDSGMAGLSRGELASWLILYRDTRRDGIARTAITDLARRGGMDRTTAMRALKRLRDRRMLEVLQRGGLNRGVSRYRVWPPPAA